MTRRQTPAVAPLLTEEEEASLAVRARQVAQLRPLQEQQQQHHLATICSTATTLTMQGVALTVVMGTSSRWQLTTPPHPQGRSAEEVRAVLVKAALVSLLVLQAVLLLFLVVATASVVVLLNEREEVPHYPHLHR
jgi:hypothetical protein